MAETKQASEPFHAVVSELLKYGFRVTKRPGIEFAYSLSKYRKEPFEEPEVGNEVEILEWSKDKKDDQKIWVSSLRITRRTEPSSVPVSPQSNGQPGAYMQPPYGYLSIEDFKQHQLSQEVNIFYSVCLKAATDIFCSGIQSGQVDMTKFKTHDETAENLHNLATTIFLRYATNKSDLEDLLATGTTK